MPSFCVLADTHKHHRAVDVPNCDVLIHCGDICSFRSEDRSVLNDIDDWFGEVPAKNIIVIGGNHDYLLEDGSFKFKNATYLQDELISIG